MDLAMVSMVMGSLDNRLVLVRFNTCTTFNIHRDVAITAQMSHLKNVLRLVGCCLEFEDPVMVYEYVEGISVFDLLFKKDNLNRKSLLAWGNRLRVAREVASAIVFLHTEFTTAIIHRNIKPHNVIIDQKSGTAKILNFALSISLPPGELELLDHDGVRGTVGYIAPEYKHQLTITQKTDVYSFGILLFQLFTGKDLYDIMKRVDSKERIDFELDAKSNTEEDNAMNSTIDSKNLPINFVDRYIKESNVMDIADPTILEEHGIHEIQQQLKDCLNLIKKCTADKGDDRPYIIHVARELGRIEKCFCALSTLGQN
ncbi:serine/threonine-protein kinase ZRK4-like [Solanum stenotomum]|uniref:serine/threonine-protein kinase ZRK4-like n=1 Tax=Solanum stenotomum TaxID=172797 RepID=UPI0020D0EE1C|nr:serine/threonine-protein kinase ZRK4-like [Solanum stenotomum]